MMVEFQQLLDAVKDLDPTQLDQLKSQIQQRESELHTSSTTHPSPEAKIAALHKATHGFFDGFSREEIQQITEDMNTEYLDPQDVHLFDWAEQIPEDE